MVSGPARPSLDVDGTLDDGEWLELYLESLRTDAFWPRLGAVAGLLVAAAGVTALLGAPVAWTLGGICFALTMLVTYTAGYLWLGPRLRRRTPDGQDRATHWRINAERLHTDAGSRPLDLGWRDVDRVRLTRRLVMFELTGGRGLLALLRRSATELGEALILGWAADGDTPISRSA